MFLFFTDENKVALINVENGIAKYSIMYPVINSQITINVPPFSIVIIYNINLILYYRNKKSRVDHSP